MTDAALNLTPPSVKKENLFGRITRNLKAIVSLSEALR